MQISIEQRNAYTEVSEILKTMLPADIAKIPNKLLQAFEKNKNPDYKFCFDVNTSFERSKIITQNKSNFSSFI